MKLWMSVLAGCIAVAAGSQEPTPLQVQLVQIESGLSIPIAVYSCGDERLFVLEVYQGEIEVITTTGVNLGTFLDIGPLVSTDLEQGLLGLAFHPDYEENGYFFINYTNTAGHTVIARYSVSADPNIADPGSGVILLTIEQPDDNHNGGTIAFGPDGYLYIGMGDGGYPNNTNTSQQPDNLLGKMLRIDVDSAFPYAIPPDNPYFGQTDTLPEIYAWGLRNPWRYSFDAVTGDAWIADVGQNLWEEINFVPAGTMAGLNFGWRCYEGLAPFSTAGCPVEWEHSEPTVVYPHAAPYSFCSITGGEVYRGSAFPRLYGHYIFTDFCTGDLYSLAPDGNSGWTETNLLTTTNSGFPCIGHGSDGELYVVQTNGRVLRITDPCGTFQPTLSSDGLGQLQCTGGQNWWWWKDGALIDGATGPVFSPTEPGTYFATASNGSCTLATTSIEWSFGGGIPGCIYPQAINYDPEAEVDDGSCAFGTSGCTYALAVNHDPEATFDDGSCDFGVPGCIYAGALNYDPSATRDDGSCLFGQPGCTYIQASNYDPQAQSDDGSCIFPGSTACPADLDGSGMTDVADVLLFIASWGLTCE